MALLVGVVTYGILTRSHDDLIDMEAQRIAEIVTTQVIADRAIYTKELVGKLKNDGTGAARDSHQRTGYIQLPAQFVRKVSKKVEENAGGLYSYNLISQWNLNEDQGLKDDFDQWAWQQLLVQDEGFRKNGSSSPGGHLWKPVSRIDSEDGLPVLRYLRADPASAPSCVSCHNSYEKRAEVIALRQTNNVKSGKQWELNELMGAIRVDIPLISVQEMAAGARRDLLSSIAGVFVIGFVGLLGVLYMSVIRPTEKSILEVEQFRHRVDAVVDCARNLLIGTEKQLDAFNGSSEINDLDHVRKIAIENASNAELAAASCGELDFGFKNMNSKFQKMLGR